ncbi:DUF6527 family protein [Chitinophaga sancti]|uniref:DUF6527 family protein n=1 Tax=Chitinophaga sancti TaxID=1004 RepID=A0ABZ0XSE4_9BACT|nr:DUF6527 family protein [Chitinophaga sancti]WQD65939.1 DUF6527 family protein [Chitinophaga sancti]WQG93134.1 DUF6527 family protein [Chitinophaga sancti]
MNFSCPFFGQRYFVAFTNLASFFKLTYDGETVSLHPSIGNWQFNCKSHYWINKDVIRFAPSDD